MEFPQYRKYANGLNYFKILDHQHLEEIQLIGKKYSIYQLEAKILPDRNHIMDLIEAGNPHIIVIPENEYNIFYNDCINNRTRF